MIRVDHRQYVRACVCIPTTIDGMWGLVVFVNLFALVVAAGVAGAALPRKARKARSRGNGAPDTSASTRQNFPWFWVVFPFTCFSAATAFSMTFLPPLSLTGSRHYADYLEPDAFTIANALSAVFIIATVLGAGLSIWAWKARRI